MKALILAAGLGSRLAPITDDRPKSMVPVNGKPIIMKQIENLYANGVDDITVVSGYKADILETSIHTAYPEVNIVESRDYAGTNNMYSAYIGISSMFRGGQIGPFLMMNADVFYDSSVIVPLLETACPDMIVVDVGRYIEESMKVIMRQGRITEISKSVSAEDAYGCSIDVYKFGADGGEAFYRRCVDYIEKKHELRLWSEVALNDVLSYVRFEVCPLNGRWVEIDNHEDLAMAEELFADGGR